MYGVSFKWWWVIKRTTDEGTICSELRLQIQAVGLLVRVGPTGFTWRPPPANNKNKNANTSTVTNIPRKIDTIVGQIHKYRTICAEQRLRVLVWDPLGWYKYKQKYSYKYKHMNKY